MVILFIENQKIYSFVPISRAQDSKKSWRNLQSLTAVIVVSYYYYGLSLLPIPKQTHIHLEELRFFSLMANVFWLWLAKFVLLVHLFQWHLKKGGTFFCIINSLRGKLYVFTNINIPQFSMRLRIIKIIARAMAMVNITYTCT